MKDKMLKKAFLKCDADIISHFSFMAQVKQVIRDFESEADGIRGEEGSLSVNTHHKLEYESIDGRDGFRLEFVLSPTYDCVPLFYVNEEFEIEFDVNNEPYMEYDFSNRGITTYHTGRAHILREFERWLNEILQQIEDAVSSLDYNAARRMVYA